MRSLGRDRGFTLIEVLVAFAIAATSLGLLFGILSSSARTIVLAEDYLDATELARSVLDEADSIDQNWRFERTGVVHDKFTWTARADRYAGEAAASSVDGTVYGLRRIDVEVVWQARDKKRRIELRTVRPFFKGPEP